MSLSVYTREQIAVRLQRIVDFDFGRVAVAPECALLAVGVSQRRR